MANEHAAALKNAQNTTRVQENRAAQQQHIRQESGYAAGRRERKV
jgi:hypothetical protein